MLLRDLTDEKLFQAAQLCLCKYLQTTAKNNNLDTDMADFTNLKNLSSSKRFFSVLGNQSVQCDM